MKHILIDFENIQPTSLDMIDDPENYHVWLFLGVHQQKILPYPLTKSLFRFASQYVHFVEMQRTGKNALDHYLAFYLGKISQIDKNAQICILARDSGYDILVEHLNATHQGLQIQRLGDLQGFKMIADSTAIPALPRVESVITTPPKVATLQTASPNLETLELNHSTAIDYPALVETAYQRVFVQLKTRLDNKEFVPTKKANFLLTLQKYFLHTLLINHNESDQKIVVERVFGKLLKYKLISIASNETITYYFSDNALRENITQFILVSKPKSLITLNNLLKQRMGLLQMPTDEQSMAKIIHWLKQKSYIYIEGNNISYEPIEPSKQEKVSSANLLDNQALVNQAINILKTKFNKNRPTKKTALINSLISHLKLTQQQAEKLIANLEKNKKLIIPSQGKVTYHL